MLSIFCCALWPSLMTSLEKCAFRSLGDFYWVFLLLPMLGCTSDLYVFVSGVQELGWVILTHNIYPHLGSFFIQVVRVCSINFPMLFHRCLITVYLLCVNVYVNSNLLNYPTCIWRTTGTPDPLWRHTACYMLPARSAPGHSSLGTKPMRLQGCDTSLF